MMKTLPNKPSPPSGRGRIGSLFALLLCALVTPFAASAQATGQEIEVDAVARDGADGPVIHGEIVKSVFAPKIDSWRFLDERRIILYVTRSRPYLITLRNRVHGFRHTDAIGIKRRGSTIDSMIDQIIIDDFHYSIERIEKLTRDTAKRLLGMDVKEDKDKDGR